MKRLMTMLAAAAMAFGLYAEGTTDFGKTHFNATGWDPANPPDEGLTWDGIDTNATIGAAGWSATGGMTVPEEFKDHDPINALNIKSPLNVFSSVKSSTFKSSTETLYIDTLVKFTAFDEVAEVGDDARIGIWLKEDETTNKTNLFITAGLINEDVIEANAYDCGEFKNYAAGEWCRLTIKSIADITDSDEVHGFVVWVNGSKVRCSESKGLDGLTLTPLAQYYANENCLFPSIGKQKTVKGELAFAGQGALDDVVFSTLAIDNGDESFRPFAADVASYKIAWDSNKMTGVMTNDVLVSGTSPVIVYGTAPATMKISWTGVGKYASGSETVDVGEDGNFDLTEIDVDEADATFGGKNWTIVKAVELANEAKGDGELALLKDVGAIEINNANSAVITLDLAGKKVNQGEASAAITLTAGSLKIVDTDGDGEVNGNGVTDQNNAIDAWDGALEIAGGTFNGVVGAGDNVLTISSAAPKFAYAANKDADDKCTINYAMSVALTGKVLVVDDEAAPAYWIVGTPKVYVAQIGDDKYESLKEAVEAANKAGVAATIEVFADAPEAMVMTNEVALTITVAEGKTVTLDPTIPANATYPFVVKANLTLTGAGTWVKKTGSASMFRVEAGKLTVNNGIFIGSTKDAPDTNGPSSILQAAAQNTSIEVNGGTFENYRTDSGCCVRADNTNTVVTIKGGSFYSGKTGTVSADNLPVTANFGTEAADVKKHGGEVVIPGNSTATFNMDETQFCAAGYKTKIVAPATVYSVVPAAAVSTIIATKTTVTGVAVGDRFAENEMISFTVDADPDTEIKTVTVNGIAATAGGTAGAYTYTVTAADVESGALAIVAEAEAGSQPITPDDEIVLEATSLEDAIKEAQKYELQLPTGAADAKYYKKTAIEKDGKFYAVVDIDETQVPPESVKVDETAGVAVSADGFVATVKDAIPGLFYGFVTTGSLGGETAPVYTDVTSSFQQAKAGEALVLTAPKATEADAAFFKISVRASAPKAND